MPARYSSAQFVGRERELTRIATALERAAGGRTTSMLLTGTAGLGATRLLDEVEQRLADLDEEFRVIRCSHETSFPGEPYGPVIAGFLPVLANLDDAELAAVVDPVAEPIARLLPSLEPRLAGLGLLPDRPWIVDPERRQARLLEALLGCIERLGQRAPVLVILEDLHTADFGTRALATFLARITRPGRVAVIATYQPDEVTRDHPLRDDLAAMAEASEPPATLALDPLGRDALAGLIEGIEERRPSASQLLLVAERSKGNPLVAEEIVIARRELTGVSLAGPFEQIVMARLADRTPECRRLLRLLALAGGPMRIGELRAALGGSSTEPKTLTARPSRGAPPFRGDAAPFDVRAAIEEADDHGYLHRPGETVGRVAAVGNASGAVIQLRHELIARAIAADLLPEQRRRDHGALAQALDGRPVASVRHWLAIHRLAEASSSALRAAGDAEAVDAPGDALAALEIALQIADRPDPEGGTSRAGGGAAARSEPRPGASHIVLVKRAAEAAFSVGRTRRAVAYIESVLGAASARDPTEAGRLYERLGHYRRVDGDHVGGLEAQRVAVRLIPAAPSLERAHALASLAQGLMFDGTFTEAKARADEAIQMADSLGEPGLQTKSHATCTLGICEAYGGDPKTAVALLDSARIQATSAGRMDDVLRAQANMTFALELQWRQADAINVALRAVEDARVAGLDAVYGNQLRGNVASALVLTGRWSEARDLCHRALEWSPAGPASIEPLLSLAAIEVEGRADEVATQVLGSLLLHVEVLPDPQFVIPATRIAASFAVWRGDFGDARRAVERGWELARRSEDWIAAARMAGAGVEALAAVAVDARERRDLGEFAEVRGYLSGMLQEAELAVARAGVDLAAGSRRGADAWLATARANAARLEGSPQPSEWDELAQTWALVGDPYQVAKARWRQAEALLATNDARTGRALAVAAFDEALAIGRELGARPLLKELAELGGRAMMKVPTMTGADRVPEAKQQRADLVAVRLAEAFAPAKIGRETGAFGLSARESEVLRLLAEGRTNREIGDRLFISQKTVAVHVGKILAKLGASGRVEAATVALRLGLAGSERSPQ